MGLKGSKPPEKGSNRAWLHVSIKGEGKFEGWIAGDPVGVEVHHVKSSKPCLKRYLGRQWKCPGCEEPCKVDWCAYVPLYRCLDARPVVVILHRDQLDFMQSVKLHQRVEIGRTKEDKIGMYGRVLTAGAKYQTTLPERKISIDISDWLPILWAMIGQISGQHIRRGPLPDTSETLELLGDEQEVNRLSPEATAKLSAEVVGQQFTVAGTDEPPPLSSDLAEVYRRRGITTKAKLNGNH